MTAPPSGPTGADDQRARPQYGEYASAAEQRARIKQPDPALQPHPVTPAVPAAPLPPIPPTWGAPSGTPLPGTPRTGGNPVDRVATIALLAYGAVNVVLSVVSYFDLPNVADQLYRSLGVPGHFTNVESARTWGIVAAVVLVVGYAVTALLSVRTLRRGRLAWWIPLVGAVVTYIVVCVCIAVPLSGDPAFVQYLTSR